MTHGLMSIELENLVILSAAEGIPAEDPRGLLQRFKFGDRRSPWENMKDKLRGGEKFLEQYVKGRSKAIEAVADILKRASLGLSGILHSSQGQKPKGMLFFAGPTGVGKTELAKSLARFLFGDDTACLRFDMSEFSQSVLYRLRIEMSLSAAASRNATSKPDCCSGCGVGIVRGLEGRVTDGPRARLDFGRQPATSTNRRSSPERRRGL
jgi:hypothetical protein